MNAHTAARMPVTLYVDGGVFGFNPSPRGVYWSVQLPDGTVLRKQDKLGKGHQPKFTTNNEAEWLAVREALQWAIEHTPKRPLTIYSDSQRVVECYNQRKNIKIERLIRLFYDCKRLAEQLPMVTVKWVPRSISLERWGH